MSLFHAPHVVTDNLVLLLDAGNTKSYPGSGTTWFDLSGQNNDGTLSAATIGTTKAGVMTFNGSDTTITITSPDLTSSNFTIMGVAKRTTGTGRLISGGSNNWLLGHWGSISRACYCVGWITPSTGVLDDNETHIYTATGDISGDAYAFYDNNTDYTTISTGGSGGPNGFVLGKYNSGTEWGTGEITLLLAYNRILTTTEITQNYNAFKSRFL